MDSVKARLQNVENNIAVSIPTVVSGRELENSLGEGAIRALVKVKFENQYITELSMLYRERSE